MPKLTFVAFEVRVVICCLSICCGQSNARQLMPSISSPKRDHWWPGTEMKHWEAVCKDTPWTLLVVFLCSGNGGQSAQLFQRIETTQKSWKPEHSSSLEFSFGACWSSWKSWRKQI